MNETLEQTKERLKAELGDKYEAALQSCYDLLQVRANIIPLPVYGDKANMYTTEQGQLVVLTKYGFEFKRNKNGHPVMYNDIIT